MLKIKHIEKIRNRPLGKLNFYVEYVKEIFDMEPGKFTTSNHRYVFGLTNREYSMSVILSREASEKIGKDLDYNLYELVNNRNGDKLHIAKRHIENIDTFIETLKVVALTNIK